MCFIFIELLKNVNNIIDCVYGSSCLTPGFSDVMLFGATNYLFSAFNLLIVYYVAQKLFLTYVWLEEVLGEEKKIREEKESIVFSLLFFN